MLNFLLIFVFKFATINVMIITLDTYVLFASLFSSGGASQQILKLIMDEKLQVAISTPVYFEYYDALTRAEKLRKINLTINEAKDVLDLLALLTKSIPSIFCRDRIYQMKKIVWLSSAALPATITI